MTKKNRIFRNKTKRRNKEEGGGGAKRSSDEDFFSDKRPNKGPLSNLQPKRSEPLADRMRLEKLLLTPNNDVVNRLNTINNLIENENYDVTYIYDSQVDGSSIMSRGNNILHQAIINDYFPQAILLIEQNKTNEEFLNRQNAFGYTPLMLSIKEGNWNVFNKILSLHENNIVKIDVGVNKTIKESSLGDDNVVKDNTTLIYCINKLVRYTYMDDELSDDEISMNSKNETTPSVNLYKMMCLKLLKIFGNELEPNYALPNGMTALIKITDIFVNLNEYPEYINIANEILDTNNYNPNSVYTDETNFGEKNATAFITCSATGVYDLVYKMLEKRNLPNLDFDINYETLNTENALFVSFDNIDIYGDGFRVANLLIDRGININVIQSLNGVKGASLLIHIIYNGLYSILSSATTIKNEEEKQMHINRFNELCDIVIQILQRPPEENNVKYIVKPSIENNGSSTTALLSHLEQLSIFKTHYTMSNNENLFEMFTKELLEIIPLAIINSTTFSLEYFEVKTAYALTGLTNETALDIAMRLQFNNVVQKIEEAILQLEEREEGIKEMINIYDKGKYLNGDEITIYEHINKKMSNIVFKLNENIYLLTKKELRNHAEKNENIVYSCLERDEFSLNNVDINVPYSLLNKYTAIQGAIIHADIMELINAPFVGQLFVLEQTGIMNSNVNKNWIDYQIGANPNWSPNFENQNFCRAGPLAIFKLNPAVPFVSNEIFGAKIDDNIVVQEEPMNNNELLKVKARVTFKTPDNRLVERGIKEFDVLKGKTTIKEIKDMIMDSIEDIENKSDNMEVRRIIFNGRDLTNQDDIIISDIVKSNDINVFQPVIVALKNKVGGKKKRTHKRRYSLKNK